MQTKVRNLDGVPIEEPVLDETGRRKQQELAEKVLDAYEETGTLTGNALREEVEKYQSEIARHVVE